MDIKLFHSELKVMDVLYLLILINNEVISCKKSFFTRRFEYARCLAQGRLCAKKQRRNGDYYDHFRYEYFGCSHYHGTSC